MQRGHHDFRLMLVCSSLPLPSPSLLDLICRMILTLTATFPQSVSISCVGFLITFVNHFSVHRIFAHYLRQFFFFFPNQNRKSELFLSKAKPSNFKSGIPPAKNVSAPSLLHTIAALMALSSYMTSLMLHLLITSRTGWQKLTDMLAKTCVAVAPVFLLHLVCPHLNHMWLTLAKTYLCFHFFSTTGQQAPCR